MTPLNHTITIIHQDKETASPAHVEGSQVQCPVTTTVAVGDMISFSGWNKEQVVNKITKDEHGVMQVLSVVSIRDYADRQRMR